MPDGLLWLPVPGCWLSEPEYDPVPGRLEDPVPCGPRDEALLDPDPVPGILDEPVPYGARDDALPDAGPVPGRPDDPVPCGTREEPVPWPE